MKDQSKTKQVLIQELASLRQRIAQLEQLESERNLAEHDVIRDRRDWENIFQAIGHPTVILDPQHRIIAANKAVVCASGLSLTELLGKKCYEIFHDKDAISPPKFCPMESLLASGQVETEDMEMEAFGGVFLVSCTPVFDQQGRIEKIIHIATDITARKQAEESSRRESLFRQSIIDNAAEGICACHDVPEFPHTRFTVWNQHMTNITGYTMDEINSQGWYQTVYPDPEIQAKAIARMARMRHGDNLHQEEWEITRKDGQQRQLLISTCIVPGGETGVNVLAVMNDITDRKKTEEALQKSEEMLRLITDNMSDMIRVTDLKGVNVFTSPSHFKGLGYRPEERVGKSAFDIVHPDDLERIINIFSEGLAANRRVNVEYRVKHADGHYVWLETVGDLLRDAQGNVTAVVMSSRDVSERKAIAEELSRNEEQYRTLIETTRTGFVILDQDGLVLDANPEYVRFTGHHNLSEIVGRSVIEWTADHEKEKNAAAVGECFGKGYIRNLEIDYVDSQGNITPIEINATCMESGGATQILTLCRDITDRKKTEDALRESEVLYRNLYENLRDGIAAVDTHGVIIECNRRFLSMLGYSFEELARLTYSEITPERWHVMEARILKDQVIVRGHSDLYEKEYIRKDRVVFPVEIQTYLAYNIHGGMAGYWAFVRDITDRKQAEEALKESENKYRLLADNVNDVIFVLDMNLNYTYVSPSVKILRGYEPEEVLKLSAIDTLTPSSWDLAMRTLSEAIELDKSEHGEISTSRTLQLEMIRKDGTTVWTEVNLSFIRDENQRPVGILGLTRDITERKRAEDEREKLQAHLARAQKLESVGTLAGGIAHDFNNLLMGIQGHASLMMLGLDPSHPHYERLHHIEEHIASGADLTRQLLGFSRGGRYDVKPVSMNDIVEKSCAMFGRTKKEINIHRKYAKAPCIVEADRSQMEQVFMNLFVNAWQAMPGGGDMFVETEKVVFNEAHAMPGQVSPGRYVKVTVTDTGTGMDAPTKERIFDPFFTTKGMGRGTGLGLATVYGIIKGHRGMITVDSEPGQGTTFTIYVLASEKDPNEEKKPAEGVLRGTETILLVDDEKMVLEVSRELLESLGYRVYAAGSGQEAVAIYMEKRNKIDLVILDMVMPGISGGETFDRLREIDPGIKVLLSSGYSINGQAQEILDRGCDGFIQKPFRLKELSRRVREALD